MNDYQNLQKIIRKGKKTEHPVSLEDTLLKHIALNYKDDKHARELHFLTLYYGFQGKAMTLELIGQSQDCALTRERVRQIIDCALKDLLINEGKDYENPYTHAPKVFDEILGDKSFLRVEQLLENEYFSGFKKNIKGLIAFLNDCDIRQIAYRKHYYFYPKRLSRKTIIQAIQKENKVLRRENTLEKMSLKAKTVTYVPDEVRQHLLNFAQKKGLNLNPLYEIILDDFMTKKPYEQPDYVFSRTKSWKARKGKAQWQQIGIYIERDVFNQIKDSVKNIKREPGKSVSLMSFICQAFVWHYEKHH